MKALRAFRCALWGFGPLSFCHFIHPHPPHPLFRKRRLCLRLTLFLFFYFSAGCIVFVLCAQLQFLLTCPFLPLSSLSLSSPSPYFFLRASVPFLGPRCSTFISVCLLVLLLLMLCFWCWFSCCYCLETFVVCKVLTLMLLLFPSVFLLLFLDCLALS